MVPWLLFLIFLSSCSIYQLTAKQHLDLNLHRGCILYEFEEACVAGIEVSVKGRNQWADPKIVKQIIGAICWYLEGIT